MFRNMLFPMLTAVCLHLLLDYFSTKYHNSRQNVIILFWKYLVDIGREAWLNLFWENIIFFGKIVWSVCLLANGMSTAMMCHFSRCY
jgi:hypothetical protein